MLKKRFQQRSIPQERDFADLIDVAECGRRAVGANPGQTPNPASGLELDDGRQLMVKPNKALGIKVDKDGVGINTSLANGLTAASDQLKLALVANSGVELAAGGLQVKPNMALGIKVDKDGVGINTSPANGLTTASSALKLAVSASNPGVQLATDGLQVKVNTASGIKVDGSGVGINTSPVNGLTTASNALKLALVANSGVELAAGGLQVKPNMALGIKVDKDGVGINTSPANGLTTASSALKLAVSASNPGVQLATDGLQVKVNTASGIKVDGSGVGINTSPANGLTTASNALKLAVSASNPGVQLAADGLKVKANAASGIKVDGSGVGINTTPSVNQTGRQTVEAVNYVIFDVRPNVGSKLYVPCNNTLDKSGWYREQITLNAV
ncbi:hypothetical protein BGV53_29625 [Burkholderia ubonensis]|nr:hypothetical protein BGV53_29625 [Burkholderia ubonensis]